MIRGIRRWSRRYRERMLDWPDCRNARDLGGLPTGDGQRIRTGALIRCDDLAYLTGEGVAAVRAAGVSRIVDLRGTAEVAALPSPFRDDHRYRWIPMIDEDADRRRDPVAEATQLGTYRASARRNAHRIVAALRAVVEAPPGAVAVHCAAGKDRTGMVVAIALTAAGVPPDVVALDYARTAECLRERHEAELAALPPGPERETLRHWQGARPETILGMLAHIEDRYGGVPAYLTRHGLTPGELAALRVRLRDGLSGHTA
jgi:protein-tyrosine phosphatase